MGTVLVFLAWGVVAYWGGACFGYRNRYDTHLLMGTESSGSSVLPCNSLLGVSGWNVLVVMGWACTGMVLDRMRNFYADPGGKAVNDSLRVAGVSPVRDVALYTPAKG